MSVRERVRGRLVGAAGVGLVAVCFGLTPRLPAQVGPAAPDRDATRRLTELKGTAGRYRIEREGDPPLVLTWLPEPILRWTNPQRDVYDGTVFLWLADGRPEVIASFYRNKFADGIRREFHEFKSLSAARLTATYEGRAIWTPRTPGIAMKPVPGAPKPEAEATGRLRQMRSLAREFRASYLAGGKEVVALRQLTQPLYRYETSRPELLDGALFAFVLATDPEVILVFEVRLIDGVPTWHYGFARMVSRGLGGWHKERLVWEVPATPHLPNNPYMTTLAPVQPH